MKRDMLAEIDAVLSDTDSLVGEVGHEVFEDAMDSVRDLLDGSDGRKDPGGWPMRWHSGIPEEDDLIRARQRCPGGWCNHESDRVLHVPLLRGTPNARSLGQCAIDTYEDLRERDEIGMSAHERAWLLAWTTGRIGAAS